MPRDTARCVPRVWLLRPAARRDDASHVHRPAFRMSDERLAFHLVNWADWQRTRASDYGRRYPSRASGRMGVSGASDFDSMVEVADAICARAVEAILDGLAPAERCAVHHRHLAAVFRFPRVELERAYTAACEAIRRGLRSRGIE